MEKKQNVVEEKKMTREESQRTVEVLDGIARELHDQLGIFLGISPGDNGRSQFSSQQHDMMNIIKGYAVKQYMGEMATMTMAGFSNDAILMIPQIENILKMEL